MNDSTHDQPIDHASADPSAAAGEPAAASPDGGAPSQGALEAAEAKAQEHYDAFLRARAEIENVRRRGQEELAKAHKYGIESFAEALVPVMDSLDAALADETSSVEKLREGVDLTRKQLQSAFERNRLMPIDPRGAKFDPHRHQAIATAPASDATPPGHVASVMQKGWMLADRVLRPAMVVVTS